METLYRFLDNIKQSNPETRHNCSINNSSFIKKYPYNGKSLHLFNKLLIIGYEKTTMRKYRNILQEQPINDIIQEKIVKGVINEIKEYQINKKPYVLTEMSSENNKRVLDNEAIIDIIFPDAPKLYNKARKYHMNHIVASVKFKDDLTNTNNIFAYIYYEPVSTFYCPKAICFVSDYPYFQSFKILIENMLHFQPLTQLFEAILYNVILFTPSPISCSFTLNILPDENKDKPFFRQLSGYPLMDINLSIIFNMLSTQMIVELFIWTFLEYNIIFYSESLDKVNMIMFIFANFNFPFNASRYYSYIYAKSVNGLSQRKSILSNKIYSRMIGLHVKYDPLKKLPENIGDHIIVDLDKPIINYRCNDPIKNKEEIEHQKIIKDYLYYIIEKNTTDIDYISDAIRDLGTDLEIIGQKINQKKCTGTQTMSDFFQDNNNNNQLITINIQEIFYNFIIKLFAFSYSLLVKHITPDGTITFNTSKKESDMFNTKEIKLFLNYFVKTEKYNNFMSDFIQKNNAPNHAIYHFTEEFINLYLNGKPKLTHQLSSSFLSYTYKNACLVHLFDVIDKFYGLKLKVYDIEFSTFYNYIAQNKKRSELNWLEYGFKQKTDKNELIDRNALYRYIMYFNNLNDNQKDYILPMRMFLESNKHSEALSLQLIDEVEKAIYIKEFSKKDLITSAMISIFLSTRLLCRAEALHHIQYFIKSLDMRNVISLYTFRKYMILCFKSYQALIYMNTMNQIENTIEIHCYDQLFNLANEHKIIPNKELLDLFNDLSIIKESSLLKEFSHITIDESEEKYSLILRYNHNRIFHKADYFLTLADNTGYNGFLTLDKQNSHSELCLKYENKIHYTRIYSPLKLATDAILMRNAFFKILTSENLIQEDDTLNSVVNICINLIFYIKNIDTFSKVSKWGIKLMLRIISMCFKDNNIFI